MDDELDQRYMERALALAAKGRGWTSPNPMVGCVIVRGGAVIGEGYHERAGGPHAEINAIESAGGDIADATVYVTLEPCAHHGRTPPCAPELIQRRPARVVAAMEDPNPKVAGEGAAQLRAAGVAVDIGVCAEAARTLNEAYIKHTTTGRPFVIAKCGMSLDGKIATRTGDSRWVTGEASRRVVHELRHAADAILTGSRTVMLDDPSLTTRLPKGREGRDPIRVVLDADEYLDSARRVFTVESPAPVWVAASEPREYPRADEVIRVLPGPGGIDMAHLMEELGARGVISVLIEGGGATHASAFEAGVVDKVMFFVAPKIIGGAEAVTAVEGRGAASLDEAIMLEAMTARPVGEDVLIEAYVARKRGSDEAFDIAGTAREAEQ